MSRAPIMTWDIEQGDAKWSEQHLDNGPLSPVHPEDLVSVLTEELIILWLCLNCSGIYRNLLSMLHSTLSMQLSVFSALGR